LGWTNLCGLSSVQTSIQQDPWRIIVFVVLKMPVYQSVGD